MAELLTAGYTHLRTTGPVSDLFVELRDDSTPILRVGTADPRCSGADNPGTQTFTFTVEIEGDDEDLGSLPTTIDGAVLYSAAEGGTQLSAVESFAPFTFGATGDSATFTFDVEVPQQV